MRLYYHKTDGGAEYLYDTYLDWEHNGKSGREGVINEKTKYMVRIDGDITKDAELTIRDEELNNNDVISEKDITRDKNGDEVEK
jgi:hypothetical protein